MGEAPRLPLGPFFFLTLGGCVPSAEPPGIQKTKLKNPYAEEPKAVAEGRTIFLESGCPKCHARGATGGKGPDLTDNFWIISGEDHVLFRTIQKGRSREEQKSRNRVGQKEEMPAWEEALEPEDIWKVIAWIRRIYKGDTSEDVGD